MASAFWRGHAYVSGRPDAITDERTLAELEGGVVDDHLQTAGEKDALLSMKEKGLLRNRAVALSWTERAHPFDPVSGLGGASFLRVVSEPTVLLDGGRASGRRVSELHLNDCLRGTIEHLAPLLQRMTHLRVLHLHDNPSLVGTLELIHFSSFPLLESLALQRTKVESKNGLAMLLPCRRLKYIDLCGCSLVVGPIPEQILSLKGLRLNVKGSGLESEDTVGNESRGFARWGKKHAARRPGGPSAP